MGWFQIVLNVVALFARKKVTSKEHDEIIARGSKKSEQLIKKLMEAKPEEPPVDESLNKAVEHKNKLLEYDRTCERRTHVIDDESDYYSSRNKWLSASERAKIEKREKEIQELRYGPKKAMKLTIDFAGRRVIEEQPEIHKIDLEAEFGSTSEKKKWEETFAEEDEYRENQLPRLTFEDSGILKPTKEKPLTGQKTPVSRLQDSDLQVMSDDGMCLSMHQPYASLLVAGIKRHEGRTWYSTHRGRLWIASAVKAPTQQEIKELENLYRHILKDENLVFPEAYPTGCLLGCVDVSDVLPQEEYRNLFPDGESESPYVFVCENPQELKVKFPVKGAHKLYKLPPQIHQAAKKSLSTLTY
ncbi:hypothetical protein QYM36_005971 [Artemia franciscana]|uniref:ASCH domain-containing protein n=1 Tax=Artemia franciscana TaxID=6661 RepID=A0AA88I2Q2_ARTSF|nr:hypothetical protein QYM36_005971 [Artemia franciscana]